MKIIYALIAVLVLGQQVEAHAQPSLEDIRRIRAQLELDEERETEKVRAALGKGAADLDKAASAAETRNQLARQLSSQRSSFPCLKTKIQAQGPVTLICGGDNNGTVNNDQRNTINSGNRIIR